MRKLSLLILSFCLANLSLGDTQAYIHTNRNEAKIENGSSTYAKNDLVPAKGLVVETQEGQRVSIVLSTKVVIDVIGKARLVIEEANQTTPIVYDKEDPYELKISETQVRLDYGKVYFSLPILRPTSSFKVSSPLGIYTLNCRYFRIDVKEKVDEVLLYDGDANFFDLKKQIKVNESMLTTLDKTQTRLVASAKRASLNPDDNMKNQFKDCKSIYESTHFDTENEIKAFRVLPKSILIENLENKHYRN